MSQGQWKDRVKVRWPNGMEEELSGFQVVQINGKDFVPVEATEAAIGEVRDMVSQLEMIIQSHQARLDTQQEIINSLVSGRDGKIAEISP